MDSMYRCERECGFEKKVRSKLKFGTEGLLHTLSDMDHVDLCHVNPKVDVKKKKTEQD